MLLIILACSSSSLRMHMRCFMKCLQPSFSIIANHLPSQSLLQPPWSPMTLGHSTCLLLFRKWPFPSVMLQFTLQDLVQTIFPETLSPTPHALNSSVTFNFYQNLYMLRQEFLPFPLEKKSSINCSFSLILYFFLHIPEILPHWLFQDQYFRNNVFFYFTLLGRLSGLGKKWIWLLDHLLYGTFL